MVDIQLNLVAVIESKKQNVGRIDPVGLGGAGGVPGSAKVAGEL